jgi:hypothetical protein
VDPDPEHRHGLIFLDSSVSLPLYILAGTVAGSSSVACVSGSSNIGQSGSGSGYRVLMTKNWKKFSAEIFLKIFLNQKLQFTNPKASIKGRPIYKKSFQLSHENNQHFKT